MSEKPLIDQIVLSCFKPLHLQAEKIKVAELLQKFSEIKKPTLAEKVAYMFAFNRICEQCAYYYEVVADLAHAVVELSETKIEEKIKMHPYIQARINAIMAEQERLNPDMSSELRAVIFDALFAPGGEFDGLYFYNKQGKLILDEGWLLSYMTECQENGLPISIDADFTPDMQADMLAIRQLDLSPAEKDAQILALFSAGGKYDGFLDQAFDEQIAQYRKNT